MNSGSLLSRNVRLRRDRLALVFEDLRLTWGQLEGRVNRLANVLLALGLGKGDKRYQQVRDVVIMADFPRSTAGKTLKRAMREPYWSTSDTAI
jgi:acyl-CoA synthetase (AMP-forming)/AMP-acid ligase II